MNFLEYMEQKTVIDGYNSAIEPFKQKIQVLTDKKDEEIRTIEAKYNTLINQEKLAMQQTCGLKPFECKHDIPVIMNIMGYHPAYHKICYCLTCGESLNPYRLNTAYIYIKRVIDKTEITPIMTAMRSRIDELWQENPNMTMLDVKCALDALVNRELSQEQRRG